MATLLREEVLRQSCCYGSDRHNSTGPKGRELFFKTKGKSSLESELMDKTEHNDLGGSWGPWGFFTVSRAPCSQNTGTWAVFFLLQFMAFVLIQAWFWSSYPSSVIHSVCLNWPRTFFTRPFSCWSQSGERPVQMSQRAGVKSPRFPRSLSGGLNVFLTDADPSAFQSRGWIYQSIVFY